MGAEAELSYADIMNEEGVATDPRRLLYRDDTPQFIDYYDDKGSTKKKTASGASDPATPPNPLTLTAFP